LNALQNQNPWEEEQGEEEEERKENQIPSIGRVLLSSFLFLSFSRYIHSYIIHIAYTCVWHWGQSQQKVHKFALFVL
jgi:hypothetical protein